MYMLVVCKVVLRSCFFPLVSFMKYFFLLFSIFSFLLVALRNPVNQFYRLRFFSLFLLRLVLQMNIIAYGFIFFSVIIFCALTNLVSLIFFVFNLCFWLENTNGKKVVYSIELKPLSGTVTNRYWNTLYPWFGNSHVSFDWNRINTKRAGVFFFFAFVVSFRKRFSERRNDDEKSIKLTPEEFWFLFFLFSETRNSANKLLFFLWWNFIPCIRCNNRNWLFISIQWEFSFVPWNLFNFFFYLPLS